jgi:Acetyltransferase (GNAT) domain
VNNGLDRIERPDDLPERWDELTTDYYQKREFLRHCHTYNPCGQRHYVFSRNGELQAGAVVYTLTLDLFTYLGIASPTTMQIVGIPASVSSSGLVGDPAFCGALLEGILRSETGLFACLNLDEIPAGSPMFVGRTWPDIVLTNRFGSWDRYLAALRSEYRRRLRQVMSAAAGYEVRRMPCCRFTDEMHALYLEVYRRSKGKLERLSAAFFRNLPASFGLTTFSAGGALRGWTITLRHGDRFSFFLGGQDYRKSPRELYLVKLLDVVRSGVESGAATIDLGQSAEVPKMRLGGRPQEKVMLAYHNRVIPRAMLRAGMGILSYRVHLPETNVFRDRVL